MNKEFGYTKLEGPTGWFKLKHHYNDDDIKRIIDPEGGSKINMPTAIPSPFARIDLFKTAFHNINSTPYLKAYNNDDGNTVASSNDDKLVSDCLDLAEMMFNIDSIKDKIRIIVWDKNAELAYLKNNSTMNKRFAETLELYLDQDKESYNFDLVKRLYLIEYNHKIIGCTSTATLFFVTANDLSHAQIKLTKNYETFDEQFTPLYERDVEFQKYLYLLFKANPLLSRRLKVIDDYLTKNLGILDKENHTLYEEINKLKADSFKTNYSPLEVSKDVPVEVLGIGFRTRKTGDLVEFIAENSEFRISSTKLPTSKRPLILKDGFSKEWLYVKDPWSNKTLVPHLVSESRLEKRVLPDIRIQYPYLTVSDFLEPYLIRLVYPINKEKFFDGNVNTETGDDSKGYLLPLKTQFFDYFTSDDLTSSLQGKPRIEMEQLPAGAVKVTLSIPVVKQGESISFERIYYQSAESQLSKPDEEKNKGVVVEHQFGVTVFPFIKTNNPYIEAHYRIQLIDRNVSGYLKNSNYELKFYSNNLISPIKLANEREREPFIRRNKNRGEGATSKYYVLENEFDYITVMDVANNLIRGIIIPLWDDYKGGGDLFKFAIDFGTTNTHIEYRIGGGKSMPFEITDDTQIATLFDPNRTPEDFGGTGALDIRELVNHEFIPKNIGNNSAYKFPIRTVMAENESFNSTLSSHTLADYNIPFIYEKETQKDRITSNLKWVTEGDKRVEGFMENLMLLLRNKVLINHGDISKTQIVWFYPSSMHKTRIGNLQASWTKLYKKYFVIKSSILEDSDQMETTTLKVAEKIKSLPESLAPFYHFKSKLPGGFSISVDLGGGTTDIVMLQSEKPILISSFRFAANAIFGGGLQEYTNSITNPILIKYLPFFKSLLEANKLTKVLQLLHSIEEVNRSEDISAFLFSLSENNRITDKNLFSFALKLQGDKDLKIIFVYFYSAIIFYISKLLEKRFAESDSKPLPNHIIFSGRGSKLLKLISDDKKVIEDITKNIFELSLNKKFESSKLSIEFEDNIPKEVTAKGGITIGLSDIPEKEEILALQSRINCLENDRTNTITFKELNAEKRKDIIKYVSDFNSLFIKLNEVYPFRKNFIISSEALEYFKSNVNEYLAENLDRGIELVMKLDKSKDTDEIEETLFFYPLIGAINNLSNHLSVLTPVNNY